MIKRLAGMFLQYVNSHRLATIVLVVALTYQIARFAHCEYAGEPIKLMAESVIEVAFARFIGGE